ncbi:hypothetical protein WA026_009329 [Henosepilachna vigintioctopunctata]|uniref:Uncharacterized protein n=1 Tax=Henosepilachna vigintioctopunctata TaxID=420089 RepID=A0AAW1UYL9_9CUCU
MLVRDVQFSGNLLLVMHFVKVTIITILMCIIHVSSEMKCEVVKLVGDKNVKKKCCVLQGRSDLRQMDEEGHGEYKLINLGRLSYICRDIEMQELNRPKNKETIGNEHLKKDVPMSIHNRRNSSKSSNVPAFSSYSFADVQDRCPENKVFDIRGRCIDTFG